MAHPTAYAVVFTWGKHKGSSLGYVRDTDPQYLQWLKDSSLPEVWKQAAAKSLAEEPIDGLNLPKLVVKSQNIVQNGPQSIGIVLVSKQTAAVRFPYHSEYVNRIKSEIDGRKWEPELKAWLFPTVHLPKVVGIFGGIEKVKMAPDARRQWETETKRRQDLDEIRVKTDTQFEIPGLRLSLYPFQRVAVEFIHRASGRCLVADACGLGKTVEAIAYAHLHSLKTLIVCPKSVTLQWREEIEKFTGKASTIWTAKTIDGHGNNRFQIVNYDAVPKQLNRLLEKQFDLLVCDEATYLKNRRTLRAKAVLGAWKERKKYPGIKTKHILFLTATPVLNRPIEAYYLLNVIDSQRFNNFYHFTQRYGGWKWDEPRNLEELHERTKDIVIRRLKKEVYAELPEKQRNDLFIPLEPHERQEYTDLLHELFRTWKFQGKATVATMPKIQGFLTEKKLARAKELIDELLEESDRSVLVFSIYIDPLKKLAKYYGSKAELLYGDTSAKERRAIVKRLAERKSRVGCVGLHSGGMGLDGLQESVDTVLFLNLDWVPAIHEQAEDRTHRIGQKKKVQVYYLCCTDTIDDDMRSILSEKQKVVDTVTDGKLLNTARNKSYFKEFVARLGNKYLTNDVEIFGE